jgi:hypothetical protein
MHPGNPSRSRGVIFPGFLRSRCPSSLKRAQGKPGADGTRSPVCERKHTGWNYRYSRTIPAFPAQWVYGLYVLSPVSGVSCHRRRRDTRQLDATITAPGPHDFAVRGSLSSGGGP